MHDLLAVATVRRLLLALGFVVTPEMPGGFELGGPLSEWIRQPREDLGGLSPWEMLGRPEGEAAVYQCLKHLADRASAT